METFRKTARMLIIGILLIIPNLLQAQEKLAGFILDYNDIVKKTLAYNIKNDCLKPSLGYDFNNNRAYRKFSILPAGDFQKKYYFQEMSDGQLTMKNITVEILPNGNLRLFSQATVRINRSNLCTGSISGTISFIFYDANQVIICQINQPLWLNSGVSALNNTSRCDNLSTAYPQIAEISGAKMTFNTKLEAMDNPQWKIKLVWPWRWPWQ